MSTDSPILTVVIDEFQKIKKLADKSIEQLPDEQLHVTIDPESNSVAVIMRHMAGNMRSRWVDFLTTDGEKPESHARPGVRGPGPDPRRAAGRVGTRLAVRVERAHAADRRRPAAHRDHSRRAAFGVQGPSRQVAHYAGHAYQILFLAKHLLGPAWKTLSIPRGQSEEFNRRMLAKLRTEG